MTKRITSDQRLREVAAAVAAGGMRLDANETAMFSRQLEEIDTRTFKVEYPNGHATEIIPLLTAIDPGASQYTYRFYDRTGRAERVTNFATHAPRVDVQAQEVTTRMHSYWAAYGYSVQDLRAAAMANLPLEAFRAEAARMVIMTKLDENLWSGDSAVNVTGLANNALVDILSPVTGTWTSASAVQKLADLQKLVAGPVSASNGVERPDTVAMSVTAYENISTSFIGDNMDKTVLDLFKQANPHIKQVVPSYRLELADAQADGGRLIAFAGDPLKLQGLVSVEFEALPVRAQGSMDFEIVVHMRAGGVAVRYPDSVKYMDGCA